MYHQLIFCQLSNINIGLINPVLSHSVTHYKFNVRLVPVMSSCHKAGCHPAFPLPYAAVAEEVIAVHHSQLAEEELYGALAPSLLRTLTLQRTQRERVDESAATATNPGGDTRAAADFTCSSKCLMSCSWLRRAWLPWRM